MNKSESIYAHLRRIVQARIDGCETCDGSERIEATSCSLHGSYPNACQCLQQYVPCPSCTPLREFIKELCWHGTQDKGMPFIINDRRKCSKCGKLIPIKSGGDFSFANPDLTQSLTNGRWTVIDLLERAGLLYQFRETVHLQLRLSLLKNVHDTEDTPFHMHEVVDIILELYTEILTTGNLLCDAVESYLEETTND